MHKRQQIVGLSALVVGGLVAAPAARAAYVTVDQFERPNSNVVGNSWNEAERNDPDFDGVGPDVSLYNPTGSAGTLRFNVPSDPADTLGDNERASKPLATANRILNGTTGTVSFQLTLTNSDARPFDLAFGVSNRNNAGRRSQTLIDITGSGTTSAALTANGTTTGFALAAGVTYNVFIVVDNTAHTYSLYANTDGDATGETPIASNVAFKTPPTTPGTGQFSGVNIYDLTAPVFYSANAATGSGDLYDVDNLAVDTAGVNLVSPFVSVPEPTTLAGLGLLAGGLLCRRRR